MITDVFHPIANIWPLLDEAELAALADDIRANGLLLPIWRHRDGRIIDGRNRWLACQRVGFEPPSETYIGADGPELVRFVLSLNEKRRHLDASQRAMVADKIAPLVRGDNQHTAIAVTTQSEAADLLNVSVDSLQRARTVHREGAPELIDAVEQGRIAVSLAAAIARAPIERQREIIMSCDEKAIRQAATAIAQRHVRENAARIAEIATRQATMPTIGYRCIVIDPPWPLGQHSWTLQREHGGGLRYPTMSLDEIAAFKLPAADDCHLFLWTTQRFMPTALQILNGWGFHYACQFVWLKPGGFQPLGLPQYNIEIVLYGRKGTPTFIDLKNFKCGFEAPRREHSRKPDEFYDMIRRVTAGPRIDIFSREPREGFDQYGNETDKFVTANDHQSSRPAGEL